MNKYWVKLTDLKLAYESDTATADYVKVVKEEEMLAANTFTVADLVTKLGEKENVPPKRKSKKVAAELI